jgi:hypothetical protein
MLTALAAGQPVVVTSCAQRGIPRKAANIIPACDSPAAFAEDMLGLLSSPERMAERHALSRRAYETLTSTTYSSAIEAAKVGSPSGLKRRTLLADEFAADAPELPDLVFEGGVATLALAAGGISEPYLGAGWHAGEEWGRWTDGGVAEIRLPAYTGRSPAIVEFRFAGSRQPVGVTISSGGKVLAETTLAGDRRPACVRLNLTLEAEDLGKPVVLELRAASNFVPAETDGGTDQRVLGVALQSVTIMNADAVALDPHFAVPPDLGLVGQIWRRFRRGGSRRWGAGRAKLS